MRRLVAVVAIVCFGGCASTATIARTDGPDNETEIESSDAGGLNVRARNGRIYRIPRESISAIDHPGNVEILVGSILIGMTVLIVYSISKNANSSDKDVLLPVETVLWGAPGVALTTSGLVKYVPSVRAASAFESIEVAPAAWIPPPPALPLPLLSPSAAPPTVSPPVPAPSTAPPPEEPGPAVVPDAS